MLRTNAHGGIYRSGKSYSEAKRCQVLVDFVSCNGNIGATARKSRVSRHLVCKLVNQVYAHGHVVEGEHGGKRSEKIDDFMKYLLVVFVLVEPAATLSQYVEMLTSAFQLRRSEIPSVSAVHRKLRKLGISRKVQENVYLERFTPQNLQRRFLFCAWRATVPMPQIYFIDETGKYGADMQRNFGYGFSFMKVVRLRSNKQIKKKVNAIACIGHREGVVNVVPVEENVNAEIFNAALQSLILPFLPPGCFLAMDNASVHRVHDVTQLCAAVGVTPVFLPPYSPDLNPIELVFGLLKSNLNRMNRPGFDDPVVDLLNGFMEIQVAQVQSFYRFSWRNTA